MEKLHTKKNFSFIVIAVDLILIYTSIFLTYLFFEDNLEAYEDNFYAFISISPYIGICYLIVNQIFELDKPRDFTFFGVAYSVTLAIICLFLATMAISFLTRRFAYPRSVLIVSSLIQIITISFWHLSINKKVLKENVQRTILIIGYEKSRQLAYKLLKSNGAWSKIRNICKPDNKNLFHYINGCDVVFLSEDIEEEKKQTIIKYCVENYKLVFYEPQSPEILLFNASFTQIDDAPILKVNSLYIGAGNRIMKRCTDIIICILALAVFFLPIIIIALSLKLGGGSVLYKQERITRYNKKFFIYKFRTMIENAEALSGPTLAQHEDNRITKIGRILRSTRLDELPQIFNILKGEMSIVGPRPERPFFVDQFAKEMPEYNMRHRVKAGLTGLAQIQGKYNTTAKDKLKYDLLYINGYSLALDIKLIMQTLNILLRKSSTEGVSHINYDEINKLFENNNDE